MHFLVYSYLSSHVQHFLVLSRRICNQPRHGGGTTQYLIFLLRCNAFHIHQVANFLVDNSADHGSDGLQYLSRLQAYFQDGDDYLGDHKEGTILMPTRLYAIISSPGVTILPQLSSGIRVIGVLF